MSVDKSPPTVRQGISRVPNVASSSPLAKGESVKVTTVYEVRNVFICIPAELSATGFELKIAGLVKLLREASIVPHIFAR